METKGNSKAAAYEEMKKESEKRNAPKRQGKGAKARNMDKLRERVAMQQQDLVAAYVKKLTLVDMSESSTMTATIDRMTKPVVDQAVPMSVTTRAVGFMCSAVYQRSTTTWDINAIAAIMTVHQLYRVSIWLVYYKLVLAQREQNEECPGGHLVTLAIAPDIEDLLRPILEVPNVLSTVLDSVGKIVTPHAVFHMGIPVVTEDLSTLARSLLLFPIYMRDTVVFLASGNPLETAARQDFAQHNSIPGARFTPGTFTLENPDEVWPLAANTYAGLAEDIHAYKNWITRIRNRLPRHAFVDVEWSGRASTSGLWSTERAPFRSESTFAHVEAERSRRRVNPRTGRSDVVAAQPEIYRYLDSKIYGACNVTFWSPDRTGATHALIGSCSMIGEMCGLTTRFPENGFLTSSYRVQCHYDRSLQKYISLSMWQYYEVLLLSKRLYRILAKHGFKVEEDICMTLGAKTWPSIKTSTLKLYERLRKPFVNLK
ncbi:hypothetical protein DMENIID0001_069710 [Sergentomyia squamirostris]